jgi:hypothetical protein
LIKKPILKTAALIVDNCLLNVDRFKATIPIKKPLFQKRISFFLSFLKSEVFIKKSEKIFCFFFALHISVLLFSFYAFENQGSVKQGEC